MTLTKDDMIDRMRFNLELQEHQYEMLLLISAHTRMSSLLPNDGCVYTLTEGPTSTGKSHTAQYLCEISHGEWVISATTTFLLDAFNSGAKMVGIDQLDDAIKADLDLCGLLESSNQFTSVRGLKVQDKKGKWTIHKAPCGGPKVFSSLTAPRKTLANRCYQVQCFPCSDKTLFSARWGQREPMVKDISASLDELVSKIPFTKDDISKYVLGTNHLDEVRCLERYEGRRLDLAHTLCAVNWALGWNVDVVKALDYEVSDDEFDAFRAVLSAVVQERGWTGNEFLAHEVNQAINEKYRAVGWPTLDPSAFGINMKTLGFHEQAGLKRRDKDGQHYKFTTESMKLLKPGLVIVTQGKLQTVRWGTEGLK